jgi:23S rRNA pseudouridine1911/1915/1917 synthase
VVGRELAGQTLGAAVRSAYPDLSWNQARALCRTGKVQVGAELALDPARRLAEGERVAIEPAAPRLHAQGLPDGAVIHVDHHVVVVDKPAGLLTVAFEAGDKDTLEDRVRQWLRRRTGTRGAELGVVQRLDKDTTGVIVFARTLAAKRHLQRLFRCHDVERRYLALVHGELAGERTLDTQLIRDRGDGLRGSYGRFRRPRGPVPRDAQRAVTHVRALERLRGATLVECRLHTGRQHQIRIHLSELGHPLIGERVYIRDHRGAAIEAARPMLHAAVLGFTHPGSGEMVRFERPAPPDFDALLASLRG